MWLLLVLAFYVYFFLFIVVTLLCNEWKADTLQNQFAVWFVFGILPSVNMNFVFQLLIQNKPWLFADIVKLCEENQIDKFWHILAFMGFLFVCRWVGVRSLDLEWWCHRWKLQLQGWWLCIGQVLMHSIPQGTIISCVVYGVLYNPNISFMMSEKNPMCSCLLDVF